MTELTTLRAVIERMGELGQKPAALVMQAGGAERVNFEHLARLVNGITAGLREIGLGEGSVAAIVAPNQTAWLVACLATINSGAAVAPIDVQFDDDVLAGVLRDCGARVVFTSRAQAPRFEPMVLPARPRIVLLDADSADERSITRLAREPTAELPGISPEQTATVFYTSGTTGSPKGVPLTHANLVFQLNRLLESDLIRPDDRMLLPLPLHHVYPFSIGLLGAMTAGVPLILPRSLTGPQMLRAIRKGQASVIIGVPRLYRAMYDGIVGRAQAAGRVRAALFGILHGASTWARRRLGLPAGRLLMRRVHRQLGGRLRVLASGGSALDPQLAWKLEGLGWTVAEGYGLTETSPLLTLNAPGETKFGSVGRPLRGVEIRIDQTALEQESVRPGPIHREGQGEVLARGPGVFHGYLNLPERTREVFTADGFFRTGDLGCIDRDNCLHILGRVSTMIVIESGENVQPENVEEAYARHPLIREIGILQTDRRLAALVVPETRAFSGEPSQLEPAIRSAIEQRGRQLPSWQRISEFGISGEPLPRTRLGKIRRQELDEQYARARRGQARAPGKVSGPISIAQMPPEDRELLANDAARQVWQMLAARYPRRPLTPDSSPALDLGVDSMEWLNLTLEIGQRTGVELRDEAIGRIETVRDLLREVAEQQQAPGAAGRELFLTDPQSQLTEEQRMWLRPQGPLLAASSTASLYVGERLIRSLFRMRIEGREHLPRCGPFLVAPNHRSYLDPVVLAGALGEGVLRDTYWGGWTGIVFTNPLSRAFSRMMRVVPVDPRLGVVSSLALGAAVLKSGHNLVWFAEGAVSRTAHMQPFRPGIGMLLEYYPVPVVPVYIRDSEKALPPGKLWPQRWPVTVRFGEPANPRELETSGKGDRAQERIAAALQQRVAELQMH